MLLGGRRGCAGVALECAGGGAGRLLVVLHRSRRDQRRRAAGRAERAWPRVSRWTTVKRVIRRRGRSRGEPARHGTARGPPRLGVGGRLELVVERCERAVEPQRGARSASRRTMRSWAAAGRADRCRSRCRARTPSWPSRAVVAVAPAAPVRAAVRRAQMGAPAVVLEAGQHPRRPGVELDLDRHVADQPRAVGAHGAQVDQADARAASRRRAGRSGRAAGSRRRRRGSRPRGRPRRAGRRACLGEVDARTAPGRGPGRRRCSRGRRRRDRARRPSPLALSSKPSPRHSQRRSQQQQVAAVGVDVHQVRVQRADAQRPAQPPNITTTLPTWSSVGGIIARPAGRQAGRRAPRARAARRRRGRARITSCSAVSSPVGGDRLAPALEHEAVAVGADRRRLAGVDDAVELAARRGAAPSTPSSTSNSSSRRRSRSRAAPPVLRWTRRAAQERRARPSAPPSSWIVCIGTRHQRETAAPARSRGRRRARSCTAGPGAPRAARPAAPRRGPAR